MRDGAVSDSEGLGDVEKYVIEFEPDGEESVTTQVALALADATGREVTELPAVGEWVDCDAVEQLFRSHDRGTELSVSFEFEEYHVFLSSIGRIVVTAGSTELGA